MENNQDKDKDTIEGFKKRIKELTLECEGRRDAYNKLKQERENLQQQVSYSLNERNYYQEYIETSTQLHEERTAKDELERKYNSLQGAYRQLQSSAADAYEASARLLRSYDHEYYWNGSNGSNGSNGRYYGRRRYVDYDD